MKKIKLTKIIASLLLITSVLALNPIGASAEWRQSSNQKWWYAEGNSWAIGWRQIDGKWYYFDNDGYMLHDTVIDGYTLSSDGAWIQNSSGNMNDSSTTTNEDGNSQVVTFTDKYLEQIVRLNINKPTGELYKSDVKKITKLACQNQNIVNLSGIENLVNLQTLTLDLNQVKDISPLKGLTNLTYLDLHGKQISDISTLTGLTNLKTLYISSTAVTDISVLKGLTNLQEFSLNHNQISDISALSGLINLQELDLYDDQISDISALKGLTNLQYLTLSNNQISDISALKGLTNLKGVYLANNKVSDADKQLLKNSIHNCFFVF